MRPYFKKANQTKKDKREPCMWLEGVDMLWGPPERVSGQCTERGQPSLEPTLGIRAPTGPGNIWEALQLGPGVVTSPD